MFGGKLFRTLVLGGITAAGCGSSGGARNATGKGGAGGLASGAAGMGGAPSGGAGGATAGGAAGGTGGAGGSAGGAAGTGGMVGGGAGTSGAGGGAGTGGAGGNTDAGVLQDANIVDGAVCCPPECEGHQCACTGGNCCWLVAPGQIPGCARGCFPHG